MKIKVKNEETKGRCPFCHDTLKGALIGCERCTAISHAECIQVHGGCAASGCSKPMTVVKPPPVANPTQIRVPAYSPTWQNRWDDFTVAHRSAADFLRALLISTLVGILSGFVVVTIRWAYVYGGMSVARWCIIGYIAIAMSSYYIHDRIRRERG